MSILETFYVLFKLDTDGIKKSASEIDKHVDKIDQKFVNLGKRIGGIFLGFASIGAAIAGSKSAAQYADILGELSDSLDVNIEDLSAWGDAVKMNGGSAEGFQETVKSMTASLADFATKGTSRAAPFFEQLGIRMTDARGKARNFIDVLPEIAGAFEKLGKAESFGIGQKMGLDQGTIMLLQKGRKEVDEVIKREKELGVVTKRDKEISEDFNDQIDYTAKAFRGLFISVNSFILPILEKLAKGFEIVFQFFRKHTGFLQGAFIGFGAVILGVLAKITWASITAFAPFYAVAAIIVGLVALFALLYEDVNAFLNGQKSLIGDIAARWPIVGEIVRGYAAYLKFLWNMAKALLSLLLDLFTNPKQAWENFKNAISAGIQQLFKDFPLLKAAVDEIGNVFASVGNFIVGVWDSISGAIKSAVGVVTGAIEKVSSAYGAVTDFFGGGNNAKNVAKGQQAIATANASPLTSQTSNSIINGSRSATRNTSIQTGDIKIQTQATDANGIASGIGKSLESEMRQAINNFDDGVVA
jgi:hypothetical protein